jgi:hypothetical protein
MLNTLIRKSEWSILLTCENLTELSQYDPPQLVQNDKRRCVSADRNQLRQPQLRLNTTARDIRNGVDHIWLVSRSGILDIGKEDLPPGSRFVPKPYNATQIIKTLHELTRALFEFNSAELDTVRGLVFQEVKGVSHGEQ